MNHLVNGITVVALGSLGAAQSVSLATVSPTGAGANGIGARSNLSADGRFVVFDSSAPNLVFPPDPDIIYDVFVRDRANGVTTKVSVNSSNVSGNGGSGLGGKHCISANASVVLFGSSATNLVLGDTNGKTDLFVRDLIAGTTSRVNVDSAGNQADADCYDPCISLDGRYVAFVTDAGNLVVGDTNGVSDVFRHDRVTGQTIRVSVDAVGNQGDGASGGPDLSQDGTLIAFHSGATNLVTGDVNGWFDVFVRSSVTGQVELVSTTAQGTQANFGSSWPTLSADARYVSFHSDATNLVLGDTNGKYDIFVKDRVAGTVVRANVSTSGAQATDFSAQGGLSADGRFIVFESAAANLVPGDTNLLWDAFVRDLVLGTTRRVSLNVSGAPGNGHSLYSAISADGRTVSFMSYANNLVPGDANGLEDIFVREEYDVAPATYCTAKTTSHGCVPSIVGVGEPSVAAPGAFSLATSQMENAKNAITFFGTTGFGNPFQGGHLCVKPPLFRLGVKNSGGASACQGAVSYTLAEFLAHGSGGASVVPGVDLYGQTWGRDPGDAFGSSLSNGVTFMVLP